MKRKIKVRGVRIKFSIQDSCTIGRIKVISTSKIKKITVIKKNCSEKGIRAEQIGSNPHSNGEGFSRSKDSFLAIRKLATMRAEGIVTADRKIITI